MRACLSSENYLFSEYIFQYLRHTEKARCETCKTTLSCKGGTTTRLKNHFKKTHGISISTKRLQDSIDWVSWVSNRLTYGEKDFYTQCAHSPTGFLFLWVYMIGTPKEAEHFTYTITVFDVKKVIFIDDRSLFWLSHVTNRI